MGEKKLRHEDIFQALSNKEITETLTYVFSHRLTLVGKCEDDTIIIVKVKDDGSSPEKILGLLKSSMRIKHPQNVTFSLVANNSKYLFNATFTITHGKTVIITPQTRLYTIQRRANERLNIPEEYYALLKFTHCNNKYFRQFGKLKNVSIGGMGIQLRGTDIMIKSGDILRGSISLANQPPVDFDIIVKHTRSETENGVLVQFFGTTFYPEGSTLYVRRMTSIISELYRDLFKSIQDKNFN